MIGNTTVTTLPPPTHPPKDGIIRFRSYSGGCCSLDILDLSDPVPQFSTGSRAVRALHALTTALLTTFANRWKPVGDIIDQLLQVEAFWALYRLAHVDFSRNPNDLREFHTGECFTICYGFPETASESE